LGAELDVSPMELAENAVPEVMMLAADTGVEGNTDFFLRYFADFNIGEMMSVQAVITAVSHWTPPFERAIEGTSL